MREKISDAFEKVQKNADLSREKQKRNYDLRAKAARLLVGDRVLVIVLAFEGKHKLADKWTADIYVVVSQPNVDIHVYRVKREDGQGHEKSLHGNNLFHLGSSLMDESQTTNSSDKDKSDVAQAAFVPLPQIHIKSRAKQRKYQEEQILHSVSDSEEEVAITEIATETPAFASVVPDEEDVLMVDDPTHHLSSESDSESEEEHEEEEDNDAVSQSAADAAEHSEEEELDMSIHGSADLIDHGDAHAPDQQKVTEVRDDPVITYPKSSVENACASHSEVQDIEQTEVIKVAQEKKTEPTVRKSSRVRKRPGWQESGDYCMSVTNKGDILKDLFSPNTLTQMHPDAIYAVIKGINETS